MSALVECLKTRDRLYEAMNITGVTGINGSRESHAQRFRSGGRATMEG
jgi:hypothetical protein